MERKRSSWELELRMHRRWREDGRKCSTNPSLDSERLEGVLCHVMKSGLHLEGLAGNITFPSTPSHMHLLPGKL